jgi:Cupin
VFKVSIRNDASDRWLENSIRFSVNEADASRAGGEAVLAKLSEVLFVETLRAYIAHLPAEQTGWFGWRTRFGGRKDAGANAPLSPLA